MASSQYQSSKATPSRNLPLLEEPAPRAEICAWLEDPRVALLTMPAFRAGVYFVAGMRCAVNDKDLPALRELRQSGLFSDDVMAKLLDEDLPPGDEPMSALRTRHGRYLPVSWATRFDRFYEAYGYKAGKVAAITAWYRLELNAAREGIDVEFVIAQATRARIEAGNRPGRSRCMPEGWLNRARFYDDIDGGEFNAAAREMIGMFEASVPRAEKVDTYSPARADAIRAALQRLPLEKWRHYFAACHAMPDLFRFMDGAIPLTAALSPEMERKAREAVRAMRRPANV